MYTENAVVHRTVSQPDGASRQIARTTGVPLNMPDIQEGSPEPHDLLDPLDPLDHPPGLGTPGTSPAQPHEDTPPLVLVVPWLHPEMEPTALPAAVRFFDPGIGPARLSGSASDGWHPPDAPLSEAMAAAFLRESAVFARERGGSRGSLGANALAGNDFYAGSALSIQAELTGGAPRRDDPAVRSQQLLLLAWQVEKQTLEIRRLEQQVQAGWRELDETLGVDEADEIRALVGGRLTAAPEAGEVALPWRPVLEAMLFFVPPGALLVTSHREIIANLAEAPDCSPTDPSGSIFGDLVDFLSKGMIETARIVRVPGWKLAGASRCPADKQWLEPERLVLRLDSAGSEIRTDLEAKPGADSR